MLCFNVRVKGEKLPPTKKKKSEFLPVLLEDGAARQLGLGFLFGGSQVDGGSLWKIRGDRIGNDEVCWGPLFFGGKKRIAKGA